MFEKAYKSGIGAGTRIQVCVGSRSFSGHGRLGHAPVRSSLLTGRTLVPRPDANFDRFMNFVPTN